MSQAVDSLSGEGEILPCAPVLLLIFNRLEAAVEGIEAIAKAAPKRVYIASDGGRTPDEQRRVERVRNLVLDRVDWTCEVFTLFRDENLGCREAVSGAVTWFFSKEAAGIVLEDDCLPHPQFFAYCTSMLEKYSGVPEIATVGGSRFFCYDQKPFLGSAVASRVFHCWGWAGWAEKWKAYGYPLPEWNILDSTFTTPIERSYWRNVYNICTDKKSQSWAYRFSLACYGRDLRHIIPPTNLVLNRGFESIKTHSRRRPWIVPNKFGSADQIAARLETFEVLENGSDDSYYSTQFRGSLARWAMRIRHLVLGGQK